jgi:hypothetical protein
MTAPGERPKFDLYRELRRIRHDVFKLAGLAVDRAVQYVEGVAQGAPKWSASKDSAESPSTAEVPSAAERVAKPRQLPSDKVTAMSLQFFESRGPGIAISADEVAYALNEAKIYRTAAQVGKWLMKHGPELASYMDQDGAGLRFEDVSGESGLPERTFVMTKKIEPLEAWENH